MNKQELKTLNAQIASLHDQNDVYNYEIDPNNRIDFPRGFMRSMDSYRGFLPYIAEPLKSRVSSQLMARDALHWIWLKTDIFGHARQMIIRQG